MAYEEASYIIMLYYVVWVLLDVKYTIMASFRLGYFLRIYSIKIL